MNLIASLALMGTVRIYDEKGRTMDTVNYSGGMTGVVKALAEQGYTVASEWDWTEERGGALVAKVTR